VISVKCPRPVAARLPNKVTRYDVASLVRELNTSAAFRGPIVWLLEGPFPILYNSQIDSMKFLLCINSIGIGINKPLVIEIIK